MLGSGALPAAEYKFVWTLGDPAAFDSRVHVLVLVTDVAATDSIEAIFAKLSPR